MTLNYSTPVVNPRLGASFAIFASAYTCLVLMLVILEQLGLSQPSIDQTIVIAPVLFYIAIGFLTRTISTEDFFLAGQRVPPFYNALALNSTVFGGSILLGSIGSLFFAGIDAIAILIGCFAGIILMGVLFVPHLRKAGANTLAGVFYVRFGRKRVRLLASLLAIVPAGTVLIAEVALGGKIAGYFLPEPQTLGIGLPPVAFYTALVCVCIVLNVVLGGMRSATWTQAAQFVVFAAILVPLVIVSLERTNLPLPQLTYGGQLEELTKLEAAKGLVTVSEPQPLSQSLPRAAPAPNRAPNRTRFQCFPAHRFRTFGVLHRDRHRRGPRFPAKAQHDAGHIVEPQSLCLGGRDRRIHGCKHTGLRLLYQMHGGGSAGRCARIQPSGLEPYPAEARSCIFAGKSVRPDERCCTGCGLPAR